jgi:hypothetical protein
MTGIQDSVPQGYGPTASSAAAAGGGAVACAGCGSAERVRAVPAVYEASRAAEESIARARSVMRDDDAFPAQKRRARAQIEATPVQQVRSALLAPAPRLNRARFIAGGVVFAMIGGFLWSMNSESNGFADSTGMDSARSGDGLIRTFAVVCTVGCGLCVVGLIVGLVRGFRTRAGRPAAEAVWRRGWYCGRCAVVSFRPGEEPEGVEAGAALDPGAFRDLVWAAGGYGGKRR